MDADPSAKCPKPASAFGYDTDMLPSVSAGYWAWTARREGPAKTRLKFFGDDAQGRMAATYHALLFERGRDQVDVDAAARWAAPDLEPHRGLLMMALFEQDTVRDLETSAGDWGARDLRGVAKDAHGSASGKTVSALEAQVEALKRELARRGGSARSPDCRAHALNAGCIGTRPGNAMAEVAHISPRGGCHSPAREVDTLVSP